LSAVTNIFLADQCWDASVEQQVISRAFRMGATGSVEVEQLLMSGTIEEQLHAMIHPAESATPILAVGTTPPVDCGASEQCSDCAPSTPVPSRNALGKRPAPEADVPPTKRALPIDSRCPSSPSTPSTLHAPSPSTLSIPHQVLAPPSPAAPIATSRTSEQPAMGSAIELSAAAAEGEPPPVDRKRGDEAKIHRLLRHMRFVRDGTVSNDQDDQAAAKQPKSARKAVSFAN